MSARSKHEIAAKWLFSRRAGTPSAQGFPESVFADNMTSGAIRNSTLFGRGADLSSGRRKQAPYAYGYTRCPITLAP